MDTTTWEGAGTWVSREEMEGPNKVGIGLRRLGLAHVGRDACLDSFWTPSIGTTAALDGPERVRHGHWQPQAGCGGDR